MTSTETCHYKIVYSNGESMVVQGWMTVERTIRAKVGQGAVIGHDGGLQDGGERTMFWRSEKDAHDDDGARAAGSVYACDVHGRVRDTSESERLYDALSRTFPSF